MSRTAICAALGLALAVFVSHKVVQAAPIVASDAAAHTLTILLPSGEHHTFQPSPGFFARSVPTSGDYFVVYQDGYQSHSPKATFEDGYKTEADKVEAIARVCHEVNRAYCLAIGDTSQPAWADAPEWQKDSARNGVAFHLANPDATPENSHEKWLEQKVAEGWVLGPVKDPEKKEHPCMVPYGDLPADQRAKDYLFRGVIHSLA